VGRIVARSMLVSALLVAVLPSRPVGAVGALDRLDRFRELASTLDPDAENTLSEVYSLLDSEVIESLGTGGVFASPEFLRDRLEAFTETWGGLAVRVLPLKRAVVAAFRFTELPTGSSVRVYGRLRGEPALLAAMEGPGWPVVRPLAARDGVSQFLVVWEGPPAANGTRPLRFDVVQGMGETIRVSWSSSAPFPEGLSARWYAVRGSEITVRYETSYPGWTRGCEGQTEAEDVYRLNPGGGVFIRASHRDVNAWHRDLHRTASRLFEALAKGDRAALGTLVPDAALRARLPATLRGEPACDGPLGPDGIVSIAAVAGARTGAEPWSLSFRRSGGRWRLVTAAPTRP
jgi:hypothetical protein